MPKYFIDILRVSAILVGSFLLSWYLPPVLFIAGDTIVPQLLLLSFVMAFMINRALARKQAIASSVLIELSRLRRLEHLSEAMSDAAFRKAMRTAIKAFHLKMAKSFGPEEKSSEDFREITHLVYRFRPTETQKSLYEDMLATTKDLALEREKLANSVQSSLSPYSWLLVLVNASFVVLFLLANRGFDDAKYIGAAGTISGVLIALDLLFQTNRLSAHEIERYREMFRRNMGRGTK